MTDQQGGQKADDGGGAVAPAAPLPEPRRPIVGGISVLVVMVTVFIGALAEIGIAQVNCTLRIKFIQSGTSAFRILL